MRTALLSVLTFSSLVFAARPASAKYPWEKPPGPIAGVWAPSCDNSQGMRIEFTVAGNKATGRVVALGAASKYGYTVGEEIFRLTVDDFGEWVGQLHWRNVRGDEHWDPIRFVATSELLNATMTTDGCYRDMHHAGKP
jgi:hypothetical protein